MVIYMRHFARSQTVLFQLCFPAKSLRLSRFSPRLSSRTFYLPTTDAVTSVRQPCREHGYGYANDFDLKTD
jgi:hypothetical protein